MCLMLKLWSTGAVAAAYYPDTEYAAAGAALFGRAEALTVGDTFRGVSAPDPATLAGAKWDA